MKFVELITSHDSGMLQPCNAGDVHRTILAADGGGYRPKEEFMAELVDLLPWKQRPMATALEAYWREVFPKCMVARDGALDLLANLRARQLKLGIVTNGQSRTQRAKIRFLELETRVDAIIISEEIGVKKPHARIFMEALTALDANAAETIFVGDDPERDVLGPSKLEMRTVWLQTGADWSQINTRPDLTITGFTGFENALTTAFGAWV